MSAIGQIPLGSAESKAERRAGAAPLLTILTAITVIGVGVGLYFALGNAATDAQQGNVQRIFYIHMPAFIGAFLALLGTVLGGAIYLRTRQPKWDTLALAGVEVGLTLAVINLITGMIWSRPIWNTWWTWDPRLTLEAIMVLTYAAYLMLRNAIDNVETQRRFASVYGMLAIITVILVLVIIRIKPDTIHPTVVGPSPTNAQGGFALSAGMGMALGINMIVWGILMPLTLTWHRIRLQSLSERLNAAKATLLNE
jgi:heme exporter protein C